MFPCPCIFLLFAYYRLLGQTVSAFSGCPSGKVQQACAVKFCFCPFQLCFIEVFDYLPTAQAASHIITETCTCIFTKQQSFLTSDTSMAWYAQPISVAMCRSDSIGRPLPTGGGRRRSWPASQKDSECAGLGTILSPPIPNNGYARLMGARRGGGKWGPK